MIDLGKKKFGHSCHNYEPFIYCFSKFRSLREYIDDLYARRADRDTILIGIDNETNENIVARAVYKYVSTRIGVVGRSRLLE
jgi:hypothetical protein